MHFQIGSCGTPSKQCTNYKLSSPSLAVSLAVVIYAPLLLKTAIERFSRLFEKNDITQMHYISGGAFKSFYLLAITKKEKYV